MHTGEAWIRINCLQFLPGFRSTKYLPLYLTIPPSLLNAIKIQIFLKIKNKKTTPKHMHKFPNYILEREEYIWLISIQT